MGDPIPSAAEGSRRRRPKHQEMSTMRGPARWPAFPVRAAAVVGLAASVVLAGLATPAAGAVVYSGGEVFPGDLTLRHGDVVLGDLEVAGTLSVPQGVTITIAGTHTISLIASRIVIAGSLD